MLIKYLCFMDQIKIYILLITFCFLSVKTKAQTFEWAKSCGSSSASFMVRDRSGNFYTAGSNISKYNPTGILIWQQPITGFGVRGIDVDSIGNLYATGVFYGTVTLGSYTLTSDPDFSNAYLVPARKHKFFKKKILFLTKSRTKTIVKMN